MFTAHKLREENIAEYLLYMWQVEDLIRANGFDIDRLNSTYLSKFGLDDEKQKELVEWYSNLIDMMRSEGVMEKGHLQINKNVATLLYELHLQLLKSPKHPFYSAAYYRALPFIVELRGKGCAKDESEIENCFDAMYGLMMLKLQGKPVSKETAHAMECIAKLLGMLSEYYKKDKIGEVEF